MAAPRQTQSNAMLYSLITFVGLFVIATVCAVIFYVKSEEYRTLQEDKTHELAKYTQGASDPSKVVGKPESGKGYLASMNVFVDSLYQVITGELPDKNLTGAVKVNDIKLAVNKMTQAIGQDASPAVGAEGVSLIKLAESLKLKLDDSRQTIAGLNNQIATLNDDFSAYQQQAQFKESQLQEQLDKFQKDYNAVNNQFASQKQQMEDTIANLEENAATRLQAEQAKVKQKQIELIQSEQQQTELNSQLQQALAKLEIIKPKPDITASAFVPDAQILKVDSREKIVYLNVGTKDRVYRGLTFAVYDRNRPIAETGEGKAENEILQVGENVSAAKINKSDIKSPIVPEDIIVNLVWDSKTNNNFVVAGEFDFDENGFVEPEGADRIKEMIERWGGKIMKDVSVETDFIVIGVEPQPLPKPSRDQLDIDPLAQQRWEKSIQTVNAYNDILSKAKTLGIPVFNQKNFKYMIGYNALSESKQVM